MRREPAVSGLVVLGAVGCAAVVLALGGCSQERVRCAMKLTTTNTMASAYGVMVAAEDRIAALEEYPQWFMGVSWHEMVFLMDEEAESLRSWREALDEPPAFVAREIEATRTNLASEFVAGDELRFAWEVGGGGRGWWRAKPRAEGTFRGERVSFRVTRGVVRLTAFARREDGSERAVPTELSVRLVDRRYEVRLELDPGALGNEVVVGEDGVGTMWVRVFGWVRDRAAGVELPSGRVWLRVPVVRTEGGVVVTSDARGYAASGSAAPVRLSEIAPLHPAGAPSYHAVAGGGVKPPWAEVPAVEGDGWSDTDGDGWVDGFESIFVPMFQGLSKRCGGGEVRLPGAGEAAAEGSGAESKE